LPPPAALPAAVLLAERAAVRQIAPPATGEQAIFPIFAVDPAVILPFILVGFVAQLIDGALGMAFGVISNTLLISLGVPPASASASVHVIKNFTGAVAGLSHVLHRNVDWRLFWRILLPGMVAGAVGAYLLTELDASVAKPLVLLYLAAVGIYLLVKALGAPLHERRPKVVEPIGAAGGFLDAVGGGGWGPIVTSNLLVQGANPRMVVGTVNTAELFLALTISGAFFLTLGLEAFGTAALGLLIGGVAAAPLGGYVAKHVRARLMLILVGIVLTATSLFGLWSALS
jgi:uncharacterized membrane protein YfcA